MRAKAKTGELLDRGEGPFDVAATQWGRERTVSAAVLRDLLVGRHRPVHAKGVRLRGVLISGSLDLEGATLRCPLSLDSCYLEDPLCLDHATASLVSLTGCQLAGLTANMLTAKQIDLRRSTLLNGPLLLMCANITDELKCTGMRLKGRDHDLNAMVAGGIKVGGSVYLDLDQDLGDRFTADGAVWLARADIGGDLACGGAQLGSNREGIALLAEGVKVGGEVFLREGFTADGAVRLLGADIAGDLSCRAAQLGRDHDGNALVADRIRVGGELHLYKGFTAAGAVVLNGADITGDLSFSGARLTGTDRHGDALVADGIQAHHDVLLGKEPAGAGKAGQPFTAAGAVRLARADIAGQLSCGGAQLTGADHDGNALVADGMKVGRDVSLDKAAADDGEAEQPFTAAGAVRLARADIAGQLSCSGAQLTGTDKHGNALVGTGMKVGAAVLLDDRFAAAGTVSVNSAHADQLVLSPASLAGANEITFDFTAREAQITGVLNWAPAGPFSGKVNLEDASVGELADDWTSADEQAHGYWPSGGQLRLGGFTYSRLGEASVEQRLTWIRSQYEGAKPAAFAAQPYEQLAARYRQAGQDTEARVVAINRRRDLRKYGNLNWYRKFGNWFLDKTIRYGYQTWRAGVGLAAVFGIFLVLSVFGQHHHVIIPTGDVKGLHPVPTAMHCTSDYPCFYPFGYTIDTVIPIINVHQADHWGPDGRAPAGMVWVAAVWVATAAGWALATLLIAGYTGLVRQP